MPTKLFIHGFAGDPLDYTKGHLELSNFIHATITDLIRVAELPDTISEATIRGVVSRTPVKNGPQDIDWNCWNWVGDALTRIVNYRYLNVSQRASAIHEMTDVCLEAEDE
ncbi:hypothetical protein N7462_010762 [Penicillium macrosclerotiorum]|uniref:uncharacterized protein n=1 Tax=Penicillium macrosclerotiorum TaxID=303699 RepID=UPI0025466E18|nr:uncharacterized protein N7462_010762 [Penicillium macrosclerotiorum]KAJ5669692.1 hypothetical protein N7462_010762 [Penicillium macrosclerotiorum]